MVTKGADDSRWQNAARVAVSAITVGCCFAETMFIKLTYNDTDRVKGRASFALRDRPAKPLTFRRFPRLLPPEFDDRFRAKSACFQGLPKMHAYRSHTCGQL